ncbi:MAG: MBL fold metallo-hydrolase [Rhizobiales bacterium]|nr:MBL fold metallo-hydrolase [Hyphomicrobiales bacterium]
MPAFICTACGTQCAPSEAPPPRCPICDEERQYVPPGGQTWTTLESLAARHVNSYREHEPGLLGIGTQPSFAIGQRALLIRTPHGNVLWDCISMLDAATVTLINALGGLKAIAISHPHFYTTMVEWSRAFGGAPIHLHAADRDWVMRPDPVIRFWDGETMPLSPDVTLIRCGGHFPGAACLHWAKGASGKGVLCTADTATVTVDRKFLTFMRSYPNLIPLSAKQVRSIAAALEPFAYDTIYGHYFDRVIRAHAKEAMRASVERYAAAVGGLYEDGR